MKNFNPLGNINGIKSDGVNYVVLRESKFIQCMNNINHIMSELNNLVDQLEWYLDDIQCNYTFNNEEDYDD